MEHWLIYEPKYDMLIIRGNMTKSQKIRKRIRYWIKVLHLKQKFIIKEATKKEKKEGMFSAYTEKKRDKIIIGFNPNVITFKKINNHIDRVILHEIGHVITKQEKSGQVEVINEYNAEKYMLNILYKYDIRLYKKVVDYMNDFLSREDIFYAIQYPQHYEAFCRVYNVEHKRYYL